ncbi:MAG: class I SAM-dependent methyltransferase [Spongiibacteraceae bacterium]
MKQIITAIAQTLADSNGNDARRCFHGRGQCFDGLGFINVDWFNPVLLVTLYQSPDESLWSEFVADLTPFRQEIGSVLVQRRYLRGGPIEALWGGIPAEAQAVEQGLKFELAFGGKQNFGFFLDMAPGREWLKRRAENKRVLNLFSYTCSFSVAAIAGGANTVLNVDMSKAALDVGRENHRLNGQQQRLARDVQFFPYDLFRSWKKIISRGPFDLVIIDPPSRQKGSFIAETDYGKVIRRLPALMPDGGAILACLNAPELDQGFLFDLFERECPEAVFVERLENRADFPETDTGRSLKMLHYTLAAAQ